MEDDRPNILYVLADDLGYGDVGCNWSAGRIATPNIDMVAATGMRFTDAHAASSVCTPSRYSLLTGEYCWRTELQAGVLRSFDPPLIAENTPTLPSILRDVGYHTACIGKWHLGLEWPHRRPPVFEGSGADVDIDYTRLITGGPLDRGFDEWFGVDTPVLPPHSYIDGRYTVGIPDQPYPEELFGLPGDTVSGWNLEAIMGDLTARAVRVVEEGAARDKPWFLYFSLTAPHTPIVPVSAWKGASGLGDYGDFVMQLDAQFGEVIDALRRTGQWENTIVVFTSDNGSPAHITSGDEFGSMLKLGHNPGGPLRGMKGDVWEAGHRVPFVASWPGRIPAGSVNHRLISLMDAIPTFASLVAASMPEGAAPDAVDVSPYLLGKNVDEPLRPWLVHHGLRGMFGLRRDRWKLVQGKGSGGFSVDIASEDFGPGHDMQRDQLGRPPYQLYDLVHDLAETHNLFSDKPRLVGELEALLTSVRFGTPVPGWDYGDWEHLA